MQLRNCLATARATEQAWTGSGGLSMPDALTATPALIRLTARAAMPALSAIDHPATPIAVMTINRTTAVRPVLYRRLIGVSTTSQVSTARTKATITSTTRTGGSGFSILTTYRNANSGQCHRYSG
jgi:hypothetical protein